MKKILLTLACVLGMSMTALAVQNSAVMLQHKDNITSYEPEQINDAIADAENGDVIYLTAGNFSGFTINKQISVKGSGMKTIIDGTLTVENPDVTLNNVFIGNMEIENGYIKSKVNNLKISQCRFKRGLWFEGITENSLIDRCYFTFPGGSGGLDISETYSETVTVDGITSTSRKPYVKELSVINSEVNSVTGSINTYIGVSFMNCLIGCASSVSLLGATIINSIIKGNTFHGVDLYKAEVINSSYNEYTSFDSDCTLTNCYNVNIEDYTSEDIATNGYLGNDGTIIGPLGGNTPYTLEPTVPHVTKAEMKVDTEKQQLNVTLTVSPK